MDGESIASLIFNNKPRNYLQYLESNIVAVFVEWCVTNSTTLDKELFTQNIICKMTHIIGRLWLFL